MDISELYGNDIDWSSVTLPEDTVTSTAHNSSSNHTNDSKSNGNHHATLHNNDNRSASDLQQRLKQMETLLAEKDARLFDLESSMAALEAETEYSIQSAQRSQQIIQQQEQDIKLMKQMVEKKNMVIVRLQNKKRGREGQTFVTSPSGIDPDHPQEEGNHHQIEMLSGKMGSTTGGMHPMTSIAVQTEPDPIVSEIVAVTDSTDSSMIGHQHPKSTVLFPSNLRQSAFEIMSNSSSIRALQLNFSLGGDTPLSIPQLCRLILSRLSSTDDDSMVLEALLELCTVDPVSRECIRRALYKEQHSIHDNSDAMLTSFLHSVNTSRIRGINLPTQTNFDASSIEGRFDVMNILTRHIFRKKRSNNISREENCSNDVPKDLEQPTDSQHIKGPHRSLRTNSLKIILALMCDGPASSVIWNAGISLMDEYFSDVVKIIEQQSSDVLDYTDKQLMVDILHFTCAFKRERVEQFFFQDIILLERLLKAFIKDIESIFHQVKDAIEESSFPLLKYLESLVRLFDTWFQMNGGFDITTTELKYDGNRFASCIGAVFAILQKALHLNDTKSNGSYLSTQTLHQIVQICAHFFYSFSCASEMLATEKRPSLFLDILQDADIAHKLVICLRDVISLCSKEDSFVGGASFDKTNHQALILLKVIEKGLKGE